MGKQTKMIRQKESTAANKRLTQWRVTTLKLGRLWLVEHSTSHQLMWCIGLVFNEEILRNPPLRQAPKHRYSVQYQNITNEQTNIKSLHTGI